MKKIKISLEDLLIVLTAMQEDGTTDIIFFQHEDTLALCDEADPESLIKFQTYDSQAEDKDGTPIH